MSCTFSGGVLTFYFVFISFGVFNSNARWCLFAHGGLVKSISLWGLVIPENPFDDYLQRFRARDGKGEVGCGLVPACREARNDFF